MSPNERIQVMTIYSKLAVLAVVQTVSIFAGAWLSSARDADSLMLRADSLRKAYMFRESVELYDMILGSVSDSVARIAVEDEKMLAENGLGMTDFVLQPTVLARHRFSVDDFYLYYPFEDKSWRPLPNVLDTIAGHPFYKAVYFPEDAGSVYFSAHDAEGTMNIYRTDRKDSTWCVPYLLNEYLVSSGDEIYPVLAPDGKHLYFASSGLYGMGGFDIYVSAWNEEQQEWGPPANLGMPYSSPYNDFLFMNTPDGRYSLFASDRDCPGDSVDVYVLEQESMPVRKSMGDIGQLRRLMALEPVDDPEKFDNSTVMTDITPEDKEIREYTGKVAEVRALRDSIYYCNVRIATMRAQAEEDGDEGRNAGLTEKIAVAEARVPVLQDSLEKASSMLQQIEMDFLYKGIILDPDKLMAEADRDVKGVASNYVFARMEPGAAPDIVVEKPEKVFDYTFMVLPEARFAEDNDLPDGLVYQIQIFTLSSKASLKSLKGLSPVFEEKTVTGRYIYRVGVFRKYNDVLSNLNRVKRLGFRTAFITAFDDGVPLTVSKARAQERKEAEETLYQVVIDPFEGELPELTVPAIHQICGDNIDIARSVKDGKVTYIVAPLEDKDTAEKLVVAVRATGVADVYYVAVETEKE